MSETWECTTPDNESWSDGYILDEDGNTLLSEDGGKLTLELENG